MGQLVGHSAFRRLAALVLLLAAPFTLANLAMAAPRPTVTVSEAYVDLRSGPGRGYPVFYSAPRGDMLEVLKERTDWYRVRTSRGVLGWIDREGLGNTQNADGSRFALVDPNEADYRNRRFLGGVATGGFGGATQISAFAGYSFNQSLSAELNLTNIVGNSSSNIVGTIGLVNVFAPEKRISPFFSIGTGVINTDPNSTLVTTQDRTDPLGYVGAGLQGYLSGRFLVRGEYRNNVVFTSRDDNDEVDEWKVGFAFFF
jgi:hypothetical protein